MDAKRFIEPTDCDRQWLDVHVSRGSSRTRQVTEGSEKRYY